MHVCTLIQIFYISGWILHMMKLMQIYVTCDLKNTNVSNSHDNIYLLKVNNKSTRKKFEMCSKLTIKTPEQRH